ncbi:cytochrome P450 [Phascolomyces articulosus]|uniref:Cytochrome P450 n=1 Tax=Phascolomyces articulosus TaxID=60185 RepID=A0AAD5KI38_9FUNG|nr:cytochrome P450 [Phascolomyces articulosus]
MSSSSGNNSYLSAATVIGGAALGILSYLAFKYPDRAVFEDVQKGIPQVKGYPLIGTFFQQLKEVSRFYDAQHEHLEKLNTMTMINSSILISLTVTTIDPRNITHILKNNYTNYNKDTELKRCSKQFFGDGIFVHDGATWRFHRKTASRVFGTKDLQKCFDRVFAKNLGVITHDVLDQYATNGSVLDLQQLILKFTMDSFVQIGFGKDLKMLTQEGVVPLAESFDTSIDHIVDLYMNPFTPIMDKLHPLLHPHTKSISQHYKELDQFANEVISERRKDIQNGKKFNDLLSQFMDTKNENGEPFTDKDLRHVILGTISAGRETTSASIVWTMYSIMTNPDVEAKFLEEIDSYLPSDNYQQDLDPVKLYEAAKKMNYAHAVFYESMRLHPPIPVNQRVAVEDDIWPDGTEIRKGNVISWSNYAQGRSSKIWGSDCLEFKPERWILEDGTLYKEEKGQWPVFNIGPRACLGERMAIVEGLTTLITLIRRYKFSLYNPDQKVDYNVRVALSIKNGLKVLVSKRI